jgi:hypothetical protein
MNTSAVVILASKGVCPNDGPVDIRRHLSEKGRVIASAEIVESFDEVTFVRVGGMLLGYTLSDG